MNNSFVLAFIAFFGVTSALLQATCYLKGTRLDPNIRGTITFTQNATDANYTDVVISVTGVTQNLNLPHGIHVHAMGDISKDDGSAALGHYFTGSEVHACPPDPNRHMGDMGNFDVDAAGVISQTKTLDKLALFGPNSIIGHAVILHSATDDCTTQPTGNSGSRLAQCVIGVANVAGNTASNGVARNLNNAVDTAVCVLTPVPGSNATFTGYGLIRQAATDTYPTITIVITNADGGVHGLHIHEFGDITTGTAVGAHWNPANTTHGMPGFNRHLGDLGNAYYYVAGENSSLYYRHDANDLLTAFGTNGPLGRALIVHQNRDDCSNPIGGSGARLASCVWGIGNPGNFTTGTDFTHFGVTVPAATPNTLDNPSILACQAIYTSAPTTVPQTSTPGTTGESDSAGMVVLSFAFTFLALMF